MGIVRGFGDGEEVLGLAVGSGVGAGVGFGVGLPASIVGFGVGFLDGDELLGREDGEEEDGRNDEGLKVGARVDIASVQANTLAATGTPHVDITTVAEVAVAVYMVAAEWEWESE